MTLNKSRLRISAAIAAAFIAGSGLSITASSFAENSEADPSTAIKAVQATLPSVAILGQKKGPADTTEVFIQVPGVLNMQSVYVLGDGESVISGVYVPPIDNGFPGAQLTLPDGSATMNPRAPRAGLNEMNQVLGISSEDGAGEEVATLDQAPVNEAFSVPAIPESDSQGAGEVRPAAAEPTTHRPDAASTAVPRSTATAPVEVAVRAPAPDVAAATEQNDEALINSLQDVAQSGAFSSFVSHMLDSDSDIDAIRQLNGSPAQPQAYLDLVASLPAIVQGNAGKRIYALFDPNCSVCHRYYNEVSAQIAIGKVEVHWIPAIVFPDNRSSLTASAALMAEMKREDGDALAMLDMIMTSSGYSERIDSAPNVDRLVPYFDSVAKNTAVMAMARAETPLLVFENSAGKLSISPGIPGDGYLEMVKSES